jgi:MFS transporter, putative metabolite:H+ symporter
MKNERNILYLTVLVSALGYFVDIYDLLLFNIVRKASLLQLGVPDAESLAVGLKLLNWQVAGLLIGGLLWGVIGDKHGRLSVLFSSIIIYSLANFANAYVTDIFQYEVCRFIAGIGLAGELGAGITIVSEIMSPKNRGFGTMIISTVGMLGAVCAAIVGLEFDWRTAFKIGGIMGFVLLFLRIGVKESGMFSKIKDTSIERGSILYLFKDWGRVNRYIKCILIGLPTYFVVGLMLVGVPELAKTFGIQNPPSVASIVIVTYIAISLADILCSGLSQKMQKRREPLMIFIALILIGTISLLFYPSKSTMQFYVSFAILGSGIGFWAVMMSNASEQFGTNIRALVTTTVPNFIRGLLIPMTFIFQGIKPNLGIANSLAVIGIPVILMAMLAAYYSKETFGKDLDYSE